MKRVFQRPKWRAYSRRRQQDELAKRRRRAAHGRSATSPKGPTERRLQVLHAPARFCLFENVDEVLRLIDGIKQAAKRRRSPYIDMERVVDVSPEALALLVSVVKDRRLRVKVNGNFPRDPSARRIVEASGFLAHVSDSRLRSENDEGAIQENRTRARVAPETAREMIRFALRRLGLPSTKQAPGAYRVLIECMSNTHQHAAVSKEPRERWWLMVHAPKESGRATFTFVDNGIGIAESLDRRRMRDAIMGILGLRDEGDLIRQLLQGEVGSRTGLNYRGKGLPAMRVQHERENIRNLRVLSNNAVASLSLRYFRHTTVGLSGTVIAFDLEARDFRSQ